MRWVLVLFVGVAYATSYGPPQKQTVTSPNGRFTLAVDPDTRHHTATAGWTFERPIQFESFCLSDDGKTAAVIHWRFIQVDNLDQPAVELWNATGRFATVSVREMIASPPRIRGRGPIGGFWREWLDDVQCEGARVVVTTKGVHAHAIDYATGAHSTSWSMSGIARYALGLAALLAAIGLVVWSARSAEHRRREALAAIAPVAGLVWIWLELAGVPYVPAEGAALAQTGLLVVLVVGAVVSIRAAMKLPYGEMRAALVAALLLCVVWLRFL